VHQPSFLLAFELGDDSRGQHFAELDAPLVERVDLSDGNLPKYAVLIERDQRDERDERFRSQPLGEDDVCRPVSVTSLIRFCSEGRTILKAPETGGRGFRPERT
jgi:hypothetical protein